MDETKNEPPFNLRQRPLLSRLRGDDICVGRIRTGFNLLNGNKESVRNTISVCGGSSSGYSLMRVYTESVRCTQTSVSSRDKHERELRQTWPFSQARRCCWEHHAGRALQDRTPPPKARLPSMRVVGGWRLLRALWRARSARAMGGTKYGSPAPDHPLVRVGNERVDG